jgi:exosortase
MDDKSNIGVLEEFRIEFNAVWERLPNKGLLFGLLGAWLLLFHFLGNSTLGYGGTSSLFNWLYQAYTAGGNDAVESEDSFRFAVPFVVAWVLWLRRRDIMNLKLAAWWPSIFLVGFGLFVHLVGYVGQQPRISIVGLVVGAYGLTGLAWGMPWLRVSFFPFFLFAFLIPLGSLAEPITFRLRLLVSQLVEVISHYVLAIDVVRQGTALTDPTGRYQYEVAAACSGVRSLVATFAFAFLLAFISLRSWWRRLLMILSAFPLAIFGNLLRMLSIVIAAEIGGQDAGTYVHDGGPMGIFSLLPYIPAFIGLLVLERYLDDRPRNTGKDSEGGVGGPPAPEQRPVETITSQVSH